MKGNSQKCKDSQNLWSLFFPSQKKILDPKLGLQAKYIIDFWT